MTFPTFAPGDLSWTTYLLFQGATVLLVIPYCSFFEWTLHRNVMHRKTWISYPFELHAMLHHKLFRWDDTFHAQDKQMEEHVTFVPRDYLLLLAVNTPVFAAIEFAFQIPILLGGWVACLIYLAAFDLLHWSFHVPRNRIVERMGWFRWLKMHHRLHHRHPNRNLNVVLPLADLVFRTRISSMGEEPAETIPAGQAK